MTHELQRLGLSESINNPIPSHREEIRSLKQKFADAVTTGMGSWTFILGQAAAIAGWIFLNTNPASPVTPWDPNLILLNLTLSCEAAFAGAFILMSQHRQGEKDRQVVQNDYQTDLRVEREIVEMRREMEAEKRHVQEMDRKLGLLIAAIPPERLKKILQAQSAAEAAAAPAAPT